MKKLFVILGLSLVLGSAFANMAQAYSTEGAMYYNEGLDFYSRGEYSKAIQSFKTAIVNITSIDIIIKPAVIVARHPHDKKNRQHHPSYCFYESLIP